MATSLRAATISELPILTASYWGSDPTYVGDQDNQENITITLPCDLRLGRRRWHINGHHDPR